MTLPVTFATLTQGNQPLSLLDEQFAALGVLTFLPCNASGSNSIILTPFAGTPTVPIYTNFCPKVVWTQSIGNTGPVTIALAGLSPLPAFKNNGALPVGNGDLQAGLTYSASYVASLNGGLGGFLLDFLTVGGRQVIGAPTTYYVDPVAGNDSYNGLSSVFTSGLNGPFKTLQHAADFVTDQLFINNVLVTIQLNNGTHGAPVLRSPLGTFNADPAGGSSTDPGPAFTIPTIRGNAGNPYLTAVLGITLVESQNAWAITNLLVQTANAGIGILADYHVSLYIGNIVLGENLRGVQAQWSSNVEILNGLYVTCDGASASAQCAFFVQFGGYILAQGNNTITQVNTPNYTFSPPPGPQGWLGSFAYVDSTGGAIYLAGATFSGTADGSPYFAPSLEQVGGYLSYPGNVAGQVTGPGDSGQPWVNYTPTLAPSGGAFTGATLVSKGRYRANGVSYDVELDITITALGTGVPTGPLIASLPVTASAYNFALHGVETAAIGYSISANIAASTALANIRLYNGLTPIVAGYRLVLGGRFEAAAYQAT
jgi:hypothetical protein